MYKTLIEQASKLKSLQPILIAAGVIYTFNIWQADNIAQQKEMQALLRESYRTERLCQDELHELRLRIYNLEKKVATNNR
jgi:hypothetical protein